MKKKIDCRVANLKMKYKVDSKKILEIHIMNFSLEIFFCILRPITCLNIFFTESYFKTFKNL